jgi:hypothetical protein
MNINQLLAWLSSHKITVAERVPATGGEVLIFTGKRPLPWDGRPQWYALPVKNGQAQVAIREIEALLRHFTHGELQIPKGSPAIGGNLAVQPLHPSNDNQD